MRINTWAAAALAIALAAAPATAQKGQGQGGGKERSAATAKKQGGGPAQAQAQRGGSQSAKAQGGGGQSSKAQRGGGNDRGKAVAERGNSAKAERGNGAKAERGAAVKEDRAKGAGAVRGNARKFSRDEVRGRVSRLPQGLRALSDSRRMSDRFVLGAAAYGAMRGLDDDALRLRMVDDRLEIRNRQNDILFDMDEDRARRMGAWDMRSLGDYQPRDNAPAFCRSGAGHPVWGREWCLDKGFGLGRTNDRLWARSSVEDIIFGRRIERDRLDRGSLIDVLGDIVFGRLALHALSLGFDQPLVGRRVYEPNSPQLLYIDAGNEPVAELVDLDGDNRVDLLFVTHY